MRLHRVASVQTLHFRLTLTILGMVSCSGGDRPGPVAPPSGTRINLRIERAELTQSIQEEDGTIPMVAGTAAAVNVVVVRNQESVDEVPLVLRLFRGTTVVFSDTTRTGGVLGPLTRETATSAQFLIPPNLVAAGISFQVELDPARTLPDSTREDNLFPRDFPATLNAVTAPAFRLRLVPVTLARHNDITGDVSSANAEQYVRLARQLYPLGVAAVTVGSPVMSNANFGPPSGTGGDANFWGQVLSEVDAARAAAGATDEYWYGVVSLPDGFSRFVFGGYGYLPISPLSTGAGSRSAAGFGVSRAITMNIAQYLLAHELGHTFGRRHAPGCGAPEPLDLSFRGVGGTISAAGNDVWSWSSGLTRGAQSVGATTGDVMGYCLPVWVSAYTYRGVLDWRLTPNLLGRIITGREGTAVP